MRNTLFELHFIVVQQCSYSDVINCVFPVAVFLSQSLPALNKILMFIRIFGGFVILKFSSKEHFLNVVQWSFFDILHYLFLYLCNNNSIQRAILLNVCVTKWITKTNFFVLLLKSLLFNLPGQDCCSSNRFLSAMIPVPWMRRAEWLSGLRIQKQLRTNLNWENI